MEIRLILRSTVTNRSGYPDIVCNDSQENASVGAFFLVRSQIQVCYAMKDMWTGASERT